MDKIVKFLSSLAKRERQELIKRILPKIHSLDLAGLDVKKMKVFGLWRVRFGNIRILFTKHENVGVIFRIGRRRDVHRGL